MGFRPVLVIADYLVPLKVHYGYITGTLRYNTVRYGSVKGTGTIQDRFRIKKNDQRKKGLTYTHTYIHTYIHTYSHTHTHTHVTMFLLQYRNEYRTVPYWDGSFVE